MRVAFQTGRLYRNFTNLNQFKSVLEEAKKHGGILWKDEYLFFFPFFKYQRNILTLFLSLFSFLFLLSLLPLQKTSVNGCFSGGTQGYGGIYPKISIIIIKIKKYFLFLFLFFPVENKENEN